MSAADRTDHVDRLRAAILDIDAHATGLGEDENGFVAGGYVISIGSLHRALGIVGHPSRKCRLCGPERHLCVERELAAQVSDAYLRDALRAIAIAADVQIMAEYGEKPNGVLLDDILVELGRPAGEGARL